MTSRIRVAWIVTPLVDAGGGAITHIRNWARYIDLQRFEPVVVVGTEKSSARVRGLQLELEPVRVVTLPALLFRQGLFLPAILSLVRFFRAEAFDIVHTVLVQSDILGTVAARIGNVTAVVSSAVGYPYRSQTAPAKKLIYRNLYRAVCPHINRIVAVSGHTRDGLVRDFGVQLGQVCVIHNGVPLTLIDSTKDLSAPSLDKLLIGTIATLIPEKGVADFVEAAHMVLVDRPDARFVIVGDGPERQNLMRTIESYRLSNAIRCVGWLPHASALEVLKTMDVFVCPSYEEGLSNVVLEAMACRRPVVATAVGGVPEAMVDGETGLLVEPGHPAAMATAILRLVRDAEWARRLGEQARVRVVRHFTADREVRAMEEVYCEVLRSKNSPRI